MLQTYGLQHPERISDQNLRRRIQNPPHRTSPEPRYRRLGASGTVVVGVTATSHSAVAAVARLVAARPPVETVVTVGLTLALAFIDPIGIPIKVRFQI